MQRILSPFPADPAAATPGLRTLGAGAQQACAGNDGRLSDARTPPDLDISPAGSYGDASHVPAVTIDAKGRIFAAASVGIGPQRVAPDANTVLCWRLNDVGPNAVNSGTAPSSDLSPANAGLTSIRYGWAGLYQDAMSWSSYGIASQANCSYLHGAGTAHPANQATTLSFWIRLAANSVLANQGGIYGPVYKTWATGAWAAPYMSMGVQINTTGRTWDSFLAVAGMLKQFTTVEPVAPGAWHLLAFTYDGAHVYTYHDGSLAGTWTQTGDIDWNGANNGEWLVSGNYYSAGSRQIDGEMMDVRIESVVRSAAYIKAMWQAGSGNRY